jgi:hypothetical protein
MPNDDVPIKMAVRAHVALAYESKPVFTFSASLGL